MTDDNVIYLPTPRVFVPDEDYDQLVELVGGDDDIADAIIEAGWRPTPTGEAS